MNTQDYVDTQATIHFDDLSSNSQDYLKAIYDFEEWYQQPAQLQDIVAKTGMKLSTISGAITRLANKGLVEHTPYGAVELTDTGRAIAVKMVRRHRLLETFLAETLGYQWNEVHDEADRLEHVVSDTMIERINEVLGRPTRDPHGDPIPCADGSIEPMNFVELASVDERTTVLVERVDDDDPELLIYLQEQGITVGTLLRIGEKPPFSNAISFTILGKQCNNGSVTTTEHCAQEVNTATQPSYGTSDETVGKTIILSELSARSILVSLADSENE